MAGHYVALDFERAAVDRPRLGLEVAVPERDQPDDLDRRRRDLERAIAAKRPDKPSVGGGDAGRSGGLGGFGVALRLSSEFIAGVLVGAGIGWLIDRLAGTSPWGLIVFLLLGFGAGILNVLRSAGLVRESEARLPGKGGSPDDKRPDGKQE